MSQPTRGREYGDLETPEQDNGALKIIAFIAVIVLIAGGCLLYGIISSMDKSLDGPNGWLVSGIANLFHSEDTEFLTEVKFRPAGEGEWGDTIIAEVGARVDVRIQYANRSPSGHPNVAVWCNLPSCLTYEEGSTMLYNGAYKEGLAVAQDSIATQGLFIGSYSGYEETGSADKHGANAYLYFTVTVGDTGLTEGDTPVTMTTSVRAGPEGQNPKTVQTDSELIIRK